MSKLQQMTKKQHKEIATIWSATLVAMAGTDSFEGVNEADAQAIVEECQKIADKLLKQRPYILTLPRIISYVLTGKLPSNE